MSQRANSDRGTTTAIAVRALEKRFGTTEALRGASLEVQRGEMFGIVGPDGAGKTTLIRILCGILKSDAGEAGVLGLDCRTEMAQIKPRIGYLSQRFSLYPDLSIDENIEYFAEIHEVLDYHERRDALLDFTRLTPFRDRLADRLSGGMKQKLALACTLIHKPDLIFLDEPTTGVDPVSRRDFWKILSSLLKEGITIVMTTPYLDEAERCSRVALMQAGQVLAMDTPAALKRGMRGTVIELVTDQIAEAEQALAAFRTGASPAEMQILDVQAFGDRLNVIVDASLKTGQDPVLALRGAVDAAGISVRGWRVVQPSLENVFISALSARAPE